MDKGLGIGFNTCFHPMPFDEFMKLFIGRKNVVWLFGGGG